MRRGAKSKDFVHPSGLGDRLKSRNKALPCQRKFPQAQAGGGPVAGVSRLCAVIVRNRCGIGGKLFDRGDGAAVTAGAPKRLTRVGAQATNSPSALLYSAPA